MAIVCITQEGRPLPSGERTDYRFTYTWDEHSDEVEVMEEEFNVNFKWPVPDKEPTKYTTKHFQELPQEIQDKLLEAKNNNQ